MTRPNYQKVLSLKPEEYELVELLNSKGIKTIDIFRKGLETLSLTPPEWLIEKVKKIVGV